MKIVTRQNNDNFKLVADVESCISMYRDLKLIDVKYTVISINEYTNQYTAFIHFEEINKPVETTNEQPKYPAIRYVFLTEYPAIRYVFLTKEEADAPVCGGNVSYNSYGVTLEIDTCHKGDRINNSKILLKVDGTYEVLG